MVTAMELGFPFLRDGMLIATDGVPPLHADESGGARLPIVKVVARLVPLGCQKGTKRAAQRDLWG